MQRRPHGCDRLSLEGVHVDDALMQAPLFSALDAEAATALRASMVELRVARGDAIFSEGEPGDRMYVILDGKVKLGQTSTDGRESLLAVLGPGEVFGELSLFDPGPRTATATAVTDVVVIGLGHDNLRPWLAGRPEVAESLLQALAQRLRRTNETLADLVFSDVPGRVAKLLLELADKFGQPGPDGVLVHHDLTQEELAQLVGASRETVNKALADFTQRGWIVVDQREVVLVDMERLARRAR
ncbi:MAG: Crp/Fnr family transcriptional regulator [Actinomycetota bacterium]